MRIEHIAMYVNDLEKARDFFEKYFGGLCPIPVGSCGFAAGEIPGV